MLCFFQGADGVFVLCGAGDGVVACAFFCLQTHVVVGVGVREAVAEEAVREGVIAVFRATAECGEVVGDVGHGFCAARHNA